MDFHFVIPVLHHTADIAFYNALGGELEAQGARVGYVALSRAGTQQLAARHPHVFYLYEGFDRRSRASDADIADIERRYRISNIESHVYPERSYYGGRAARVIARAVHTFRFLERLCDANRVGAFINNVGAEIVRRSMARIADAGGPPNIIVDFAPIHGRIALTTNEMTWDSLPARAPALTPERRAAAEALLLEATTRRRMFATPAKLGINLGSLYRPVRNAIVNRFVERKQVDYEPGYIYHQRLKHLVRRGVSRLFYGQPGPGEPYLFFPLHDPRDSALTVRAPQFQAQENVLEYISTRALPTGFKLYVKPHPAALDSYPIGMLARVRGLPNVRLMAPQLHSHQMIEGSRGAIVINSTVGFEALLYGKPVVVLGHVFYRGRGITWDVENLAELPEIVHRAVTTPVDGEAVLRFLGACLDATWPGRFGLVEPENLRLVASALLEKASRLGVAVSRATVA